ncbi:hypothetical protein FC093_09340 [Ilyomonas limi]|uniref:Uncharacterized protein n=1 Tax=Ilyomonas limi TaxID=2575867 RepID=A0A4U3L188_9BACT|nr:hypothetical protein [Ilyomonas limi]TKK68891.1 hypothetical protein FC093_09340 [Ilyomonas limi]
MSLFLPDLSGQALKEKVTKKFEDNPIAPCVYLPIATTYSKMDCFGLVNCLAAMKSSEHLLQKYELRQQIVTN